MIRLRQEVKDLVVSEPTGAQSGCLPLPSSLSQPAVPGPYATTCLPRWFICTNFNLPLETVITDVLGQAVGPLKASTTLPDGASSRPSPSSLTAMLQLHGASGGLSSSAFPSSFKHPIPASPNGPAKPTVQQASPRTTLVRDSSKVTNILMFSFTVN